MNPIPAMLAWTPGLPELIIILVIVVLLFGAKKLPDLARSLGASIKEFKKGTQENASAEKPASTTEAPKKPNGQ